LCILEYIIETKTMFDSSARSRRNVKLNVYHDLSSKSFGSNAISDNKPIIMENKTDDGTCNGGKQQTYDGRVCCLMIVSDCLSNCHLYLCRH
jgi:hypothetical protein